MTPQQLELKRAHGTVEEFTDAVINAIGEISVMEAQAAIARYRQQWKEAGDDTTRIYGSLTARDPDDVTRCLWTRTGYWVAAGSVDS